MLGNVLENAIEEDTGAVRGDRCKVGTRSASEFCVLEIDGGLAVLAAWGQGSERRKTRGCSCRSGEVGRSYQESPFVRNESQYISRFLKY